MAGSETAPWVQWPRSIYSVSPGEPADEITAKAVRPNNFKLATLFLHDPSTASVNDGASETGIVS